MDKSSLNPFRLLSKIFPKPTTVPAEVISSGATMSEEDKQMLQRIGVTTASLRDSVFSSTLINFERGALYKEIDLALTHWLVGSASELYADVCTTYSPIHDSTVWVTAESKKYQTELTKLFERVGIEEKIYDWAWSTGAYGDLFVKMEAQPGLGIVSVDDNDHPLNTSRVDRSGVLVGFFKTPMGNASSSHKLLPPWEYIHFRIAASKRRRPMHSDPMFSEYRTVHLMAPDTRRVSSKYGSSVLLNGLPVYKRLRLAEDNLLLTRMTRGILRYIYKIRTDSNNIEAVSAIIDEYKDILKNARAINTTSTGAYFDEKSNPMGSTKRFFRF